MKFLFENCRRTVEMSTETEPKKNFQNGFWENQSRFRKLATSKIGSFATVANGWNLRTFITKSSILDLAGVLNPLLKTLKKFTIKSLYYYFSQTWFSFKTLTSHLFQP